VNPLELQEVGVAIISRQSAHEGGKAVSPTHRPHLPPQEISLAVISFKTFIDASVMMGPEGLSQ
jgi:hypothetical protein